jgi:catechol 2,3-dioxygenase-like lactoylglutathione lyase family enzyme
MAQPRLRVASIVLGTDDPRTLGRFYERLLGWTIGDDESTWVTLVPPEGRPGLSFQYESEYVRPVWPSTPDHQQMTAHLDIAVEDLDQAAAWALSAGATLAEFQPQDEVRVMLDPAGHPFCLFVGSV